MERTTSVAKVQMVVLRGGERTWTVLDGSYSVVGPAEEFLEFMRATARSPNTVKSYSRALALWWEFLAAYGLARDEVRVDDFGAFLTWLRSADTPAVASIARRLARFSEETIAVRLQAVMSLYCHHHLNGVEAASRLYERLLLPGGAYKPFLEHIAQAPEHQAGGERQARPAVGPADLTPPQDRRDLRRVRPLGSSRPRVDGDAAGSSAVGAAGRDGPAVGRSARVAASRLAYRPRGYADHRGPPTRARSRGAGQGRRLSEAVHLRRA